MVAGHQGAVVLTVGSVPHRIVPELRHFHLLLEMKLNNQSNWHNSNTVLRGTGPIVSATAPVVHICTHVERQSLLVDWRYDEILWLQFQDAKNTFLMACSKGASCVAWLGVGMACYKVTQTPSSLRHPTNYLIYTNIKINRLNITISSCTLIMYVHAMPRIYNNYLCAYLNIMCMVSNGVM